MQKVFNDLNGDGQKQDGEDWIDGLGITWTDPIGGQNKKWSYWAPELVIFHEAHVEAVEDGEHRIDIRDQPGCKVGRSLSTWLVLHCRPNSRHVQG